MLGKSLPPFPWSELLSWYEKNGRHHLPWRRYEQGGKQGVGTSISPTKSDIGYLISDIRYRVWLAEILLQQTQVDRVIPYFERILERYPTIHDLARASYEEFFPYYQGMGYYSRARNMLKLANIVSQEYEGIFPREKKILQKLPGVGGYTSSAILAFGYGEPYLAWDTNLEKVFARYYNGRRDMKLTESEKEKIEEDFREFLRVTNDEGRVTNIRAINNALMDFAATVDLKNPENIDWESYPIHSGVWYETRGSLEPREEKKNISFPIPDATVIVILHQDHKVYYCPGTSHPELAKDPVSLKHGFFLRQNDGNQESSNSQLATHNSYLPFLLPPALTRDTRQYVQSYFRDRYRLELSVRPVHAKWISEDGKPYIAVNAQIQAGDHEQLEIVDKKTAQEVLKKMIP